jgi:hypothetical protein
VKPEPLGESVTRAAFPTDLKRAVVLHFAGNDSSPAAIRVRKDTAPLQALLLITSLQIFYRAFSAPPDDKATKIEAHNGSRVLTD